MIDHLTIIIIALGIRSPFNRTKSRIIIVNLQVGEFFPFKIKSQFLIGIHKVPY